MKLIVDKIVELVIDRAENIVEKKCWLADICPFSTMFTSFLFRASKPLNPFPNKPWFLRVRSTSLLKTL